MPNEIFHIFQSGSNLDAYVWRVDDDTVFDQADGGDTFETWADGNVLNYDIPMADNGGDYYTVDFPAVITTPGVYRAVVALRTGVNAAVGDTRLAQGEGYWDGSGEINFFTEQGLKWLKNG